MGYMEMRVRIAARRRELGLTQAQLAAQLKLTPQSVSAWERGKTVPEAERLEELAAALQISVSSLLEGTVPMPSADDAGRMDDVERMRAKIEAFAVKNGLEQTRRALSCAIEQHSGQYRKGIGEVPYVVHPMDMVCHAIALGIQEDAVLAAALLHDVCEDCGAAPETLPVGKQIQDTVRLVTFTQYAEEGWEAAKERYYAAIRTSREAMLVKLLDRCNNVSAMADAFAREKLRSYIEETRRYVLPLAQLLRQQDAGLESALYLLEYHISSVIFSVEAMLGR
ncbi:MAG: helix-turn-helix domain-containing protein [Ruminococcaceae bacterium]|nr:helix-turn-helix domain-containing protein [Oscillospiraceae bacterium]